MRFKRSDKHHIVTALRHWISARATNSGAVIRLIRAGRAPFAARRPVLAVSAHVTRNWKKNPSVYYTVPSPPRGSRESRTTTCTTKTVSRWTAGEQTDAAGPPGGRVGLPSLPSCERRPFGDRHQPLLVMRQSENNCG